MMLEAKNLRKSFAGLEVLRGLSFSVGRGTVSTVVGPNGAGKTTLFNILNGFLKQDAGTVLYRGESIDGMPPEKRALNGIGRLWQDARLFQNMTVLENLLVARNRHPGESVWRSLLRPRSVRKAESEARCSAEEILTLIGLKGRGFGLAGELSYGQQKLLAIGRLLMGEAEVLLLDEPLSGVSHALIDGILAFIRSLADGGKTILVIEHNVTEALSISDDVFVMEGGRVDVFGVPSEVAEHRLLREVYA
jgi:ABC-type branched-subunit amino acid transport system ATPase component